MSRKLKIAVAAYMAMGVITFGHSAAGFEAWQAEHCATQKQRTESGDANCYAMPGFQSLPAAIAWPLYWSWEAWS